MQICHRCSIRLPSTHLASQRDPKVPERLYLLHLIPYRFHDPKALPLNYVEVIRKRRWRLARSPGPGRETADRAHSHVVEPVVVRFAVVEIDPSLFVADVYMSLQRKEVLEKSVDLEHVVR